MTETDIPKGRFCFLFQAFTTLNVQKLTDLSFSTILL